MKVKLVGEANDYVGKGMAGGEVVIVPPPSLALQGGGGQPGGQHLPLWRDWGPPLCQRQSRSAPSPAAAPLLLQSGMMSALWGLHLGKLCRQCPVTCCCACSSRILLCICKRQWMLKMRAM